MNALEELIKVCERYWKSLEDIDYWWVGWEEKNKCIFDSNSIEIMIVDIDDKCYMEKSYLKIRLG